MSKHEAHDFSKLSLPSVSVVWKHEDPDPLRLDILQPVTQSRIFYAVSVSQHFFFHLELENLSLYSSFITFSFLIVI